jgi:hypothetical protein
MSSYVVATVAIVPAHTHLVLGGLQRNGTDPALQMVSTIT